MSRKALRTGALVAAAMVALAACGSDTEGATTTTAAGGAPAPTSGGGASSGGSLSGSIFVSGSSTVEPITALVAEDFARQNSGVTFKVDGPGTGDGFELFCSGETDISDASRAIKAEEAANCEAAGIEFVELKVAIDGLSVITSQRNDAVECLSFPDLYALLGPESESVNRWSDANALGLEVGGSGDYPDAPLFITAPGEESGTYDSFVELVIEGIADDRGQDAATRKSYQASPNDNVIIDGIAGNDTSLGWVGYSFAEDASDRVKLLAVEEEEGAGCVEPTPETIADNTYPISRPLFIYVSMEKLESNPTLEAFVDYYMSDAGIASVAAANYVELDSSALAETRSAWSSKTTGTREG